MGQDRANLSEDEQNDLDHELLEEANQGRVENLAELIEMGANPNRMYFVSSDESSSAMLEAAKSGSRECVLALLEAGGRFDLANSHGVTPLHAAATRMNEEFCVWLVGLPQAIEAAPRIDVHQLLKDCCLFGLPKMLQAVLDRGYLKVVEPEGMSALLAEAALTRKLECFRIILGAAKSAGCEDRLNFCKSFHQCAGSRDEHINFMRWLLENTPVAEQLATESGPTPVETMLSWNHPRAVHLLVDEGYFPRPSPEALAEILVAAVRSDHLETVELLLQWGVDRHADVKGRSLLQLARKEPMRRLLRSARSQRAMEDAMGGEGDAPAAPRRDPGPL